MTNILNELRFTVVAAVLAIALILTAAVTNIDLVKLMLLDGIEKHEVDDVLSGLTLIFAGLIIDRVLSHIRKCHQAEIEAQKLRTLKATMRTVQDIVNNFLNILMLFEIAPKAGMPYDCSDSVEELIHHTAQKLKALGDLTTVREIPLGGSVGIEYPERCQVP